VNVEQAPKPLMRRPTRLKSGEGRRLQRVRATESWGLRRGIDAGMQAEGIGAGTREALAVRKREPQPTTREGEVGPSRVAERPVVPRKPGNAGGGKGP